MPEAKILVLGKIKSVRGIRGGLRIIKKGGLLDRFKTPCEIQLYSAEGIRDGFLASPKLSAKYKMTHYQILSEDTAEIQIANLTSREEGFSFVGLFIGLDIETAREKFHDPDNPYLFEYLNCEVYEGSTQKGVVDRVEEYQYRQWLIVTDENHKEFMLPLQGGFIERFDVKSGKIFLSPGNGLFEV